MCLMKKEQVLLDKCPSFDELSAWFDKELNVDTFEDHVSQCNSCQNCIGEIQIIHETIAKSIDVSTETISRIKKNCIEGIGDVENQNKDVPIPFLIKIAACFLFISVTFFLVHKIRNLDSKNGKELVRKNNENNSIIRPPLGQPRSKPVQSIASNYSTKNVRETPTVSTSMKTSRKDIRTISPTNTSKENWYPVDREYFSNDGRSLNISDINLVGYSLSRFQTIGFRNDSHFQQ